MLESGLCQNQNSSGDEEWESEGWQEIPTASCLHIILLRCTGRGSIPLCASVPETNTTFFSSIPIIRPVNLHCNGTLIQQLSLEPVSKLSSRFRDVDLGRGGSSGCLIFPLPHLYQLQVSVPTIFCLNQFLTGNHIIMKLFYR